MPLDSFVPMELYHSLPLSTIFTTAHSVSTLFTTVGFCRYPLETGNGGRSRGSPRLPSADSMRADSSPQTYAPAPNWILMSNANPALPATAGPRKPRSRIRSSVRSR